MSFNVHQLLHLTESVHHWGPLWCHSRNLFESGNGNCVGMVHAANGVVSQICRNLSIKESLRVMEKHLCGTEDSPVMKFCYRLTHKCTAETLKIRNNRYFGANRRVQQDVVNVINLPRQHCKFYNRLFKNGSTFKTCQKVFNRSDNTFAITKNNAYIKIVQFVVDVRNNLEMTVYQLVNVVNAFNDTTHLKRVVSIQDEMSYTNTSELDRLCVMMSLSEKDLLSIVPYTHKFS